MIKPKSSVKEETLVSYNLERTKDGYQVNRITLVNNQVKDIKEIHPPDVLSISMAILARELRKDMGAM